MLSSLIRLFNGVKLPFYLLSDCCKFGISLLAMVSLMIQLSCASSNSEQQENALVLSGAKSKEQQPSTTASAANKPLPRELSFSDSLIQSADPTLSSSTHKVGRRGFRSPKTRRAEHSSKLALNGRPTVVGKSFKSPSRQKRCLQTMKRVLTNYRRLFNTLEPDIKRNTQEVLRQKSGDHRPLVKIVKFQINDCKSRATRQKVASNLRSVFAQPNARIGVILPMSGPSQKVGELLLDGLKAALKDRGHQLEDSLVVIDSGKYGSSLATEKALAELIFSYDVNAVIGGMAASSAAVLDEWSRLLGLPTLLLTSSLKDQLTSDKSFSIYPSQERLAATLARTAMNKGMQRVAIFRSKEGKANSLINQFRKTLIAEGGQITHDLTYDASDYDDLQQVVSKAFQINIEARAEEYAAQVEAERLLAEDEGTHFNIHKVILKPKVTFDAILLPDDFRTVRHFIKLFRYHGVDNIPLIGGHAWRSPALVAPFEPALKGSFFGDFIGTYDTLPKSLGVDTFQSKYFVKPSDVLATDFKMIGYRIGLLSSLITNASTKTKNHIAKALLKTKSNDANFFGKGRVFDDNRQSLWPTYLFTIGEEGIAMD